MRRRISGAALLAAVLLAALVPSVAASNPSCVAQFTSTVAQTARPLGQVVVVPEVRSLSLGGPNLGQEVKGLFATADREDCPVVP
jgi:hypothetical protein